MAEIRIAPMTPAHLAGALHLSREAGWPHRAEDWALSLAVSEGVVALAGDEVLGTALCTRMGQVATFNLIIVAERCRGRGLGRQLMAGLLALGQGCELRLCATEDGQPLYEKLGFEATGQVLQHQGIVTLPAGATEGAEVTSGTVADLPAVLAADHAATGMERAALLGAFLAEGELLLAPRGHAVLRPFGRGQVLGPVTAEDPGTARALILAAARRCEGRFLRIDLAGDAGLAEHAGLAEFVTALGLVPVGGGTAMQRDARPRAATPFRTFALASQAFG